MRLSLRVVHFRSDPLWRVNRRMASWFCQNLIYRPGSGLRPGDEGSSEIDHGLVVRLRLAEDTLCPLQTVMLYETSPLRP